VTITNWIIVNVVMPLTLVCIGWIGALAYERQLRREAEREDKARHPRRIAHPGSSTCLASFSIAASAPEPPRSGWTRRISRW